MQTREKMVKIVNELLELEAGKIKNNSKFSEDLGADSIDVTETMAALEHEFSITILDEDVDNLVTFGDALLMIESKLKQKNSA